MNNRIYELILDRMLRSIERRDGRSPQSVADVCGDKAEEGKYREAICQILTCETLGRRFRLFVLYPELLPPYLLRIRQR
jgi:hypothetical protein